MASVPRLDSLTGLRFIAALHVALAHLPHLQRDESISLALRRCVMSHGPAVPFFFILSGFLLAYRYQPDFAVLNSQKIRKFYFARFARIWPLHLLTLGLAFYLSPNPKHQNRLDSAILNACLVQSWVPVELYSQSYNSVAWTLSIEVFFYLCTPFLFWLISRNNLTPPQLMVMMLPLWLAAATQSLWLSASPSHWATYLVAVCPVVRLGEFVIGIMLAMAFVRGTEASQSPPSSRDGVEWTVVEAISLFFLASLVYWGRAVPLYLRLNGYFTISLSIVIMVFARQKGYLSSLFASSGFQYLGRISFAFFMVHCLVFVALDRLTPSHLGSWERAAIYLQGAGLVAVLVHHTVEVPVGGWLLNRTRTAPALNGPAVSANPS